MKVSWTFASMNLPPEIQNDLLRRIRQVSNPLRVVLFGSRARGTQGPDSDLDVLVIVANGEHRRKTQQALYRNMIGFAHAVDLVVATESDVETYRDCKASVLEPALREGVDLHAA